VEFGDEG
jgi:hypothetical protein